MSTSLTLAPSPVDFLAIEVKTRLLADPKIAAYRKAVERVPTLVDAVSLVPGNILVAVSRFDSRPIVGCYQHEADIGVLLSIIKTPNPLNDDEAGPATLVDTVVGMIEDWNKTVTVPGLDAWTFKGVTSTFFDVPEVEGQHRPTGRTLAGFVVTLKYSRQRHNRD